MGTVFYISAGLATLSVALAMSSNQAVHALLYILAALLALSLNLFALGNELFAVLLVIVYAGAIMVLFIFVVMLLNPPPSKVAPFSLRIFVRQFLGPLIISSVIFSQFLMVLISREPTQIVSNQLSSQDIASALFNDGWYFVEMLSMLLTAAFVGAFHLGKRRKI